MVSDDIEIIFDLCHNRDVMCVCPRNGKNLGIACLSFFLLLLLLFVDNLMEQLILTQKR